MKLKRYIVFDFTTLVGVNESGKSNMLLALWKLNPVRDGEIDILHDMPVDKLGELRNHAENTKFITAEFILESKDINILSGKYDFKDNFNENNVPTLEVSRFYDGKYTMLLNKKSIDEYSLLDKANENKETEVDLGKDLLSMMPKFVYYSNYGNLSSRIYLPHAVEWLKGNSVSGIEKNDEQIRTIRILFDFVNLSPEEILESGRDAIDLANLGNYSMSNSPTKEQIAKSEDEKEKRSILLQSASNKLTSSFKDWWKQGNYKFRFMADGDYFTILVSDEKRPVEVDLRLRSTGLQWFLSFYLTFLVESEEAHENAILLLDEAGLTLHPLAQKDLVHFFNRLASKNQLINTTHSPFIVDTDNMDRCKVVYVNEDGLTEVSSDLRKNIKNNLSSVYAVHAALGLGVSDVLLQGCQMVVVEGVSDQYYLNAIKNYLISAKEIRPNKDIVFIPSGGVKNIASISSLIGGKNSDIPYIIIDSDKSGEDLKNKISNGLYKNSKDKILEIKDITGMVYSEVEDLFPYSLFEKPLLKLFKVADEDFDEEYDSSKPIVDQIEEFARNNEIVLASGWKVELAKAVKIQMQKNKPCVDKETLDNWKELFKKFVD